MSDDSAFCTGPGYVMLDGFQSTQNNYCLLFLFKGAVMDTSTKYAFALIGTILLGLAIEPIRLLRGWVMQHKRLEARVGRWPMDLLEGLLFGLQMMVAYWLMLLAMLYEYGIFICILVGLAAGRVISCRIERSQGGKATQSCSPCCGEANALIIKDTQA
eukprot:m.54290 g.54290  ORF g.54290 m.54290 type:complete len:159 (-) comp13238_c0_seq1:455-931(-)